MVQVVGFLSTTYVGTGRMNIGPNTGPEKHIQNSVQGLLHSHVPTKQPFMSQTQYFRAFGLWHNQLLSLGLSDTRLAALYAILEHECTLLSSLIESSLALSLPNAVS